MYSPCRIERLEARIAPANVTATLSGGILKLVSPDADVEADFQLWQTGANSFALHEIVAGLEEQIHFTGVKAIKATLTPLGDHAVIYLNAEHPAFRGSISVDGLAGPDFIGIGGGGVLAGNLTIMTVGPSGGIELQTAIRGKTNLSAAGGGVEIYGEMGSLTATGFSNVGFYQAVDIRGPVKITAPPLTPTWGTANGGHFRGDVTIIGNDGYDSVDITGEVDGDLIVKLRGGDNTLTGAWLVHGAIKYFRGAGADHIRMEAGPLLSTTMNVSAGDGDNSLEIANVGDLTSLIYQGGAHGDSFTLGVGGGEFLRARIKLGNGVDEAVIRNKTVLDLRVDGGRQDPVDPENLDTLRAVAGIEGMTIRGFENLLTIT